MSTCNAVIRKTAKEKGVYLWEIANALGICEASMTRKMRVNLPETETKKLLDIIEKLSAEKENASC